MGESLKKLLVIWRLAVTVAIVVMIWTLWARSESHVRFDELTVQRVNVIEPNGQPRVIVSSKARFPGIFFEGKEYRHATRDTGGFLFFNSEGDEAGGLTFDGQNKGDAYEASAGMSFDRFKQDQTVVIRYDEKNGHQTAGVQIVDRPSYSILPVIEMHDRAAKAGSAAEREAILEEKNEYVQKMGPSHERAFFGKILDGSAVLKLADKKGNPRLLLSVDAEGNPSLRFLDEEGEVVVRLPDE